MGELHDWLAERHATPEQEARVEAAIGRIAVRLVREAASENGHEAIAAAPQS